ncbi:MAG: HAD family phosphatase [Bifidobacteriaceae bacterium]|jgi:putative hydrolase of the HAD superfamily|nr:HAD family phosphatase [Bifidobacteriaceae bacterium]
MTHARAVVAGTVSNVIFDFGNVLVDWDPTAALVGRYNTRDITWFLWGDGGYFSEGNNRTNEGDALEDVLPDLRVRGGEKAAEMFQWYWNHAADAIKGNQLGARQLVEDVKAAGVHVYGLSNWPAPTFDAAFQKFSIFSEMEDIVISGRVKMRKPQASIYELALHQFGIVASQTMFIDDSPRNVTAARDVGMQALHFDGDPYHVRAELIAKGLAIPAIAA